jgi:predicted GTPase
MNQEYSLKDHNSGFILVGNKVDLERMVSRDLIQILVGEDRYFHTYVETSSIYGIGITEILDKIVHMGRKLLNLSD